MSSFIKNSSVIMSSGGIVQPIQTEWVSLTYSDVNALSGNQGLGTFTAGSVEWKRDGCNLLYKGKLTAGTTTASEARIPYPAGLIAADTTKISSLQIAGKVSINQQSSIYFGGAALVEPSVGYFTVGQQGSTYNELNKQLGNAFLSVGQIFSFSFTVPIQSWLSTSSATLNQVVNIAPPTAEMDYYLEAAGNAGQAITANVTDIPFIATTQNNLTWDGSGFTAPISGNYEVMGSIYTSTISSPVLFAYINTVQIKLIGFMVGSTGGVTFSGKVYLTAGQRLSLRCDTGFTCSNNAIRHVISITRLNGKLGQTFIGNVQRNQIAYIKDVKASGVNGGTFTSGAWQTRDLNTVSGDSSIVSLAANVFTLQVGEYDIEVEAPAYGVLEHQVGIAVSTSSTPDVVVGGSSYATPTYSVANSSFARTKITVTTTTSYKILHRCSSTYLTNGFGVNLGTFGTSNIYTQVKITKLY
jgi:hypothetical protein